MVCVVPPLAIEVLGLKLYKTDLKSLMTAKTLWESSHKLEQFSYTIWELFWEAKGTNIDKSKSKDPSLTNLVIRNCSNNQEHLLLVRTWKINWIRNIWWVLKTLFLSFILCTFEDKKNVTHSITRIYFLKKHRTLKNIWTIFAWKFNKLQATKTEKQQELCGCF